MDALCADCSVRHSDAENKGSHPAKFLQCCDLSNAWVQTFRNLPETLKDFLNPRLFCYRRSEEAAEEFSSEHSQL